MGGGVPWPGHPGAPRPGSKNPARGSEDLPSRPAQSWPPGGSDGSTPRQARVPGVLWPRPAGGARTGETPPTGPRPSLHFLSPVLTHLTSLKMRTLRARAAPAPGGLEPFRWLREEVCCGGGCRRGPGRPLLLPPPLASSSVSPLYLHPASPSCSPREHPSSRLLGPKGLFPSCASPAHTAMPGPAGRTAQGTAGGTTVRIADTAHLCVYCDSFRRGAGECLEERGPFPN